MDELKKVHETGEPLMVTLHKRPIVTIHPYREETPSRRMLGTLKGRMEIHGDIVHSDFADDWEVDR